MPELSVSVVIPFYSHKEWLIEAIDSVLCQSYPAKQVIVVNDGSSEIIDFIENTYSDKVTFIRQKNGGAAAARNRGIEESTGDIIAFLDSDDLWDRQKLEKYMAAIEKYDYKWCVGAYELFGYGRPKRVIPYISSRRCYDHMCNTTRIATPTVMIRRNILGQNPFPENMKCGEDICLWYRLGSKFTPGVIREPLVKVRERADSSRKNTNTWLEVRAILWEKMHYENELPEPRRRLTRIAYRICYNSINTHNKGKKNSDHLNLYEKIHMYIAWGMFRIDELVLRVHLFDTLEQEEASYDRRTKI